MSKKLAITLIITAFLIGAIVTGGAVGYFCYRLGLRFMYMNDGAKAVVDVSVLNQLQANNVTNAVRLLDGELDGSLVSLWVLRKDIAPSDRETVQKILRAAKKYRTKFPHESGSSIINQTVSNALSLVDVPVEK